MSWLGETARSDQPDRQGDAVELATFHAAKGLEWPVVHLAGLEQGLVPIGHARTDEDLAEERRLFYVAITRAEQEVRLTWAQSRTFGERTAARVAVALPRRGRDRGPGPAGRHRAGRLVAAPGRPSGPGCGSTPPGPRAGRPKRERAQSPAAPELDAAGQATFEALKAWRSRQAKAAAVPAYVIFHDRVLVEVAATRPGVAGRAAGRSGHRPGQGRALRRRDPGHPGRACAILNPCDSGPSSASRPSWPR